MCIMDILRRDAAIHLIDCMVQCKRTFRCTGKTTKNKRVRLASLLWSRIEPVALPRSAVPWNCWIVW